MASASSVNGMTASTGPNSSCDHTGSDAPRGMTTVGASQYPLEASGA